MEYNWGKILLSLCFLIFGVIIMDVTVGKVCQNLFNRLPASDSQCARVNHILTSVVSDCLIVGSSRANHHYVSSLMEDSLGMPVYNTGMDGQTLPYISCVVNAVTQRKAPRLIVMEMHYNGLLIKPDDAIIKLKPYEDSHVRDIIIDVYGGVERYKCMSAMYRYNGYPLRIVNAFMNRLDDTNGYIPLDDSNHHALQFRVDSTQYGIDSVALDIFDRTVDIIRKSGSELIVVISPMFIKYAYPSPVERICEERGIFFIDNSALDEFMEHEEYFKDHTHLNALGAEVYTKIFIHQLKESSILTASGENLCH